MKKALAMILALVMIFALAACGGSAPAPSEPAAEAPAAEGESAPAGGSELAGTYDITVWVADAIVDLTKQQIDDFNASNTLGITFKATVEAVGEGDAATQMITDVEAGGDLFCFAQDQFARLVQAGALAKLGQQAAETVRSANDPGVVAAATAGEELFAYPLTSDNGYFMYYDKSVIPEEDVGSLEKLIEDCEAAGKYFSMENETS
ncbi:MAG: extracellular solute-binding protein, partial [Oscillospiraceae bacterium]|nr:extracellular solute-binding protein [Oscillospiraceae bacterium]